MIKTTHNEHEIQYCERTDKWECRALEMEAKTLSAIKTLINKHDADLRRVDQVEAYQIKGYWGNDCDPCTVAMIDGESEVWITTRRGNSHARRKVAVNTLAPKTNEIMAMVKAARALDKEAEDARTKASDAWKAIPRFTTDMLREVSKKKGEAA